jgi:hypothetical protein
LRFVTVLGKPDAEGAQAHHNRLSIHSTILDDRTAAIAKQPKIPVGKKRTRLTAERSPQRANRLHRGDAIRRANVEEGNLFPQLWGYVRA